MTAVETGATRSREGHDLASMLFTEPPAVLDVPPFAWGHGGLHGGLALSLVASSMRRSIPDHALRSITGHFHRPIRETLAIESRVIRSGRSAGAVQATGSGSDGTCLTATAVFGSDQAGEAPTIAREAPDVPGPDSLPALEGLAEKVPVLSQVDLRPVGPIRLYAGAADPTMTAWMRVEGRDAPVDPCSLIFFLDGLPPSYTAVLTQPRPVPTLEFSAHVTSNVPTSPWVLVRSRTVRASEGCWVTESIEAWDRDGAHLGSGRQLRLAATNTRVTEERL
ncbi:acyl-CoA thioesterase [Saccharopolyspora mangrovi]|uniref:Thioesterase family protein n=1 Tax=Saccharopolyspora mangrovi TaxID=3082379 RepID=A0ABU6AIG5_9PSEU|nr:thioesterase family protein [Saccharopolyspora sp. S2-29]MEB3371362.1 thioesterase family protein [Saccharopolyspora sp. S2-29]